MFRYLKFKISHVDGMRFIGNLFSNVFCLRLSFFFFFQRRVPRKAHW